jgi:hypothetical protein
MDDESQGEDEGASTAWKKRVLQKPKNLTQKGELFPLT